MCQKATGWRMYSIRNSNKQPSETPNVKKETL